MSVQIEVMAMHPYDTFDTVLTFTGIDVANGDHVKFAVDHRPAQAIREMVLTGQGGHVVAVEEWAILSRVTPS